ncbi:acyltransferase family protein [Pseudomonas sp. CC120222-01a]|uniref:acyltransferase family protein n=1 Tax=Pseudomonas sp. CC120222-01a TaxID=1378075 RepID=UPI000DA134F6|nr:acyltransferase family protein [Pseudomonas sp. CC120222-01a]
MTLFTETGLQISSTLSAHPKYRPDIDGLRAVAVLSVVFFHAFPSWMQGGFVGVDVFFVISGFLISSIIFGSLERGSFGFLDFYSRRVNRIFPALLLVLSAAWAFGWFSLMVDEYSQLGKHIAGGSAFISNFVLLGESGYFDNSAETKPLLHLWSLGIEEQFYLIWPLVVWAAWRSRLSPLVLILIAGGVSFALNIIGVGSDKVSTFYSPQTRFWELLVGSLLALVMMNPAKSLRLHRDEVRPLLQNFLSLLGMMLIVTAIALTTKDDQFPGWWAILPTVGAALIIAAGPFSWINKTLLSSRIMVWFGLISFPLYLWHWPLLSFTRMMDSATPSTPVRIAAVIASVILAWLTYRFVEKPIRSKLNPRASVGFLSIALAGVGITGFATFKSDGLPSRFPAEIQAIADFKYDFTTDARYPECWLSMTDPYDGFAPKCLSGNRQGEGILVWGDSHAARLYPGIVADIGASESILQATRSACPPILNFGDSLCQQSNQYILDKLGSIKPRTVVLFGAWGRYRANWAAGSEDQAKLTRTIKAISSAGVSRIIVLGPAPEWLDVLSKLVYKSWESDFPRHQIPSRLTSGLNQAVRDMEGDLREAVENSGASYASVFDILCNSDGCLTHITDDASKLTSWDYGHPTTDASLFISRHMHQALQPRSSAQSHD